MIANSVTQELTARRLLFIYSFHSLSSREFLHIHQKDSHKNAINIEKNRQIAVLCNLMLYDKILMYISIILCILYHSTIQAGEVN